MRIRLLLTAVLLNLSLEAHALQLVEVVDGQTVAVKVSARELTRIGMADGGRITRVWGLEERMQAQPDKESGQIFVRPAQGRPARPFSFFVRDSRGATYTLLAVPVDMPSGTVLLRPKAGAATDAPAGGSGKAYPYIGQIKALVRALAKGAVPTGYTPVLMNEPVPLWEEARIRLVARYAGPLTGEVYELTNVSGTEMRLDEREFGALSDNIKAVAIVDHALAPGQSTRIYLVREVR